MALIRMGFFSRVLGMCTSCNVILPQQPDPDAPVRTFPVLYLLRFTDYIIMDQPEIGALYALTTSVRMTRSHLKELLMLDLRFWWYYLLELLVAVVSYYSLALLLLLGLVA